MVTRLENSSGWISWFCYLAVAVGFVTSLLQNVHDTSLLRKITTANKGESLDDVLSFHGKSADLAVRDN
jgi:hypothetical protein